MSSLVLTPEAAPYLTALRMEVSASVQYDYPTTAPTNSSYYQPSGTEPGSVLTELTTVVISNTATVTLTTIVPIISGSTLETLAPTEAPSLPSRSTNINLSAGQIAGIVLGAITGLILCVLIFYLVLTRARWVGKLAQWRLKEQEKRYRRRVRRQTERDPRVSGNARRIRNRKRTRRRARRPLAPMPTVSVWMPWHSDERMRRRNAVRRGHKTRHRR
ncbi:hypothetical protein F5Y14DRAFT_232426 [Nemania sp. NC0429]|nr:hypothetical protein F5Y14DRAFT_232426 [Nemania sp. NC0429]